MSCVEQGEFDHQVRVNPHLPMEIQQISSGFNEMVAHLEMLIAKVKQAVLDQKNAELSAWRHRSILIFSIIRWIRSTGRRLKMSSMRLVEWLVHLRTFCVIQ